VISTDTDERLDKKLGQLLRGGVVISATVVLIGGIVFLARHGYTRPDYHQFRSEPETYRCISGILRSALSLSGRAIIQLGLLLLIATPVARVVWSVLAFARARDKIYVGATLVVLALLLYSLFLPHS
jgi:uncharacterized membrane protein